MSPSQYRYPEFKSKELAYVSDSWTLQWVGGFYIRVDRALFEVLPIRGSDLYFPIRKRSIERAALRPSAIAQTTSDCPRCISPAANTPGAEVR